MHKYAIYARKSDDDTSVTEKSIQDQLAELNIVRERENLTIVKTWQESKSAKKPDNRPLYQELISSIERGEVDSILCYHINRLVRNMQEGGQLIQMLIEGTIKEIRTPYSIHRAGDNIIAVVVEAAQATQFSLDLSKAVVRGMESKFNQGGYNHKAPQGYLNARDPLNPDRGIIIKDPERYELIQKAWQMMLTGSYSIKQVADTLNNVWGYRTRRTRKIGGSPLSYTAASEIFSNIFYTGFIKVKGRIAKGQHFDIAMVSASDFNKVQEILGKSMVQASSKTSHFFTGLMTCGYCGQQITAETKVIKSNGKLWTTYHCSDSYNVCTQKGISQDDVENGIADALESITIDSELCDIAIDNIVRELDQQAEPAQKVYEQQHRTLEDCEKQLVNLSQMWIKGLITDETRYKQLEGEILSTKNGLSIAAENSQAELARMRANAIAAGNYVKFARTSFVTTDLKRKREIAHALGLKYLFYGKEKKLEIEINPLLTEIVKYAKQVEASLEPKRSRFTTGSDKQKTDSLQPVSSFGGP